MLHVDVVHPHERVEMCTTGVSLETLVLLAGCTTSTYNNKNIPKLIIFNSKFYLFLTIHNPIFL